MGNPDCPKCTYKKNTINDNCALHRADDGYVVRCAPGWTSIKHKAIEVYSSMITIGMRNKWEEINYIDLFSGPGKYYERNSGRLLDGSPLIAMKCNYHNLYLNDLDGDNFEALKSRTYGVESNVFPFNRDANEIAVEINAKLPRNSLNFCFLDPNHMGDLKFELIRSIAGNKRRVDLLINFAYGMDFRRWSRLTKRKYTEFFGTDEWISILEKYKSRDIPFLAKPLIELYMEQLVKLGYKRPPKGEEHKNYFLIKNFCDSDLYYLVYASKSPRGYDFCKKMRPYVREQQELF